MSKKTRKKSLKKSPEKSTRTPAGKTAKAAAAKAPRAASVSLKSAKSPQSKGRPAKAVKTTGNATRKPAKGATPTKKAIKAESQKVPSKPLKSAASKAPARSKAPGTPAGHPQLNKPAAARKAAPAVVPPAPKSVPAPVADSAPRLAAQPVPKPTAKSPASSALTEGVRAPAFQLPRDGGGTVSLSDYAGRKLVLFFYPRADTPGCTKEAIDFTRLAGAFAESQTGVLGVSADPPRAQEAFRDKHQLATPLVSDERHEMLEAYGVWGEKSMYGRTFLGIVRTTVLIGADGRVLKIWRNVKVDGHADEVLAAVRAV
jgi:peroxiredoxin Q/BCP